MDNNDTQQSPMISDGDHADDGDENSLLDMIVEGYVPIHPPLVIFICVCGAICNVTMILVLSRRAIFSPTNLLLLSLSTSQLCLLLNYLYITLYKLFADIKCYSALWNSNWVYCLLLNVNLSVIFHTAAVFHVVTISFVRFVTLAFFSRRQNPWFTLKRSRMACLLIYATVLLISIPFYLNSEVVLVERKDECTTATTKNSPSPRQESFENTGDTTKNSSNNDLKIYSIQYSKLAKTTNLLAVNFWLFGIVCKLIPCLTVLALTVVLSRLLRRFELAAASVRASSGKKGTSTSTSTSSAGVNTKNYSRTSYMILSVMVLFVLVELPQGILNLLMGIFGQSILFDHWHSLADLFEMLTVLYSSVNFVIFCSMSGQFRAVFSTMIRRFFGLSPKPSAAKYSVDNGGRSVGVSRRKSRISNNPNQQQRRSLSISQAMKITILHGNSNYLDCGVDNINEPDDWYDNLTCTPDMVTRNPLLSTEESVSLLDNKSGGSLPLMDNGGSIMMSTNQSTGDNSSSRIMQSSIPLRHQCSGDGVFDGLHKSHPSSSNGSFFHTAPSSVQNSPNLLRIPLPPSSSATPKQTKHVIKTNF